MKKNLLIKNLLLALAICISASVVHAQQNDAIFDAYAANANQALSDAVKSKDYKKCMEIFLDYAVRYDKLSPALKNKYVSVLPNTYYNLACYQSLLGQKEDAITSFSKAYEYGYLNYAHSNTDTDLDPLRSDPRFKAVMEKMREKGDYGYILRKAGPYKTNPTQKLPMFTYQDQSAPELVAFRKKYNLDSIMGNGDETSKFKKLLYWAHNVVRHDGQAPSPYSKNADDLITICKKENRAINCRMMAILLNDAYQAVGYQSRVITCMPKDPNDADCHVINVVWSKEKQKWIWMDPTFNAYVSDDKGNLLSIEEVRERLIAQKPLVLNEDANWNNQNKQTKANYLDYYMSKNLYFLFTPTESVWDIETAKPGKTITYVVLYPSDYSRAKGPMRTPDINIEYANTNDPAYFWQKPTKASVKKSK